MAGTGTQTAGLATGGSFGLPTQSDDTEEYDGSTWTSVNDFNTARRALAGFGTQTSTTIAGGTNGSSNQTGIEQYDGTNWTTSPATLSTARRYLAGFGSSKSSGAFCAGRNGTVMNNTEEFNTSVNTITAAAWASGNNMNTGRGTAGDCGTYLAGLVFGGNPIAAPYQVALTEEYNGTSWTESGDLAQDSADVSGAGTQTAALAFAFSSSPNTITQHYDGSTWTTVPGSLPTAQNQARGIGTQTAAISVGYGSPGTESYEYDGSSWTASGDLNNKRSGQKPAGWGIQTAAILASGYQTPPATIISNTETYDGTSWTETGNSVITPVKRTAATTAGTNSDGMINGGGYEAGSNNSTAATQGYNGTSWFTQPSLATARTNGQGFGTSTNAVACGGNAYPGGTVVNATEEFTGETTSLNLKTITDS
jgi:hypothetical protein